MAGMIFSTYAMFLPAGTVMACAIILCVGFFGIYIPYQERKKVKKTHKVQKGSVKTEANHKKLDQLNALKKAGILTEEEYQAKKRGMK